MTYYRKLFSPGKIGNCELKNRIIVSPFLKNYANRDGSVTQRLIDYWVERAKGGVGLIMTGTANVSPESLGNKFQEGLYDDFLIDGYKKLTDAVHQHGAKIGIQMQHRGRHAGAVFSGFQPVAPSPISPLIHETPPKPSKEKPRELSIKEIKKIVNQFGEAAVRAKKAGFDLIEIHGAHGYLIHTFLSPYSNKRIDQYGGSKENRERFAMEIISCIKEAIGEDFPLIYRFTGDEFIDGGRTLEDNQDFATRLEKAGIHAIDVSVGMDQTSHLTCTTLDLPQAPFAYLAAGIKEKVNIPVAAVNRINDPDLAESILEEGKADFICMARPIHADPYFPLKAKENRKEDISNCIGCLQGCVDIKDQLLPIECVINPAAGREREFRIKPARNKKSVLIIGGGPAGMEAARVSSLRGHEVTLFDNEQELGGQIKYVSRLPHNDDFDEITRYLSHQLKKQKVEIKLNTEVTVDTIYSLNPDVVILATGAIPYVPTIPGVKQRNVMTFLDILKDSSLLKGKKAVVVGRNELKAVQVAEYIAERNMDVSLITPFEGNKMVDDGGQRALYYVLPRVRENKNITIYERTTIESINKNSVSIYNFNEESKEEIKNVDIIVLAVGTMSRKVLSDKILYENRFKEIYSIGDCVVPRKSLDAMREGSEIGNRI